MTMAIALLAACAGHPSAPPNIASSDYNYLIGPLDTLNISVWRNPDLSMTVPVRPQALPYRQRMTLLDVMIAVGGLTDFADGNNASVLRTAEGRQYRVRLKDLVRRGDVSANIQMQPGDVLIIPQSWF